jgi:glutamine synthetase adenylyltransferase
MRHPQPNNQINDRLIRLCTSSESVSSLIAKDPDLAPGDAWEKLYGDRALKAAQERSDINGTIENISAPLDELEKATLCGKWGPTRPSELFLKVWLGT